MPQVISKTETVRDVQKILTYTTTRQGTEEITPEANARSYRQEHVDGIWTLIEEYVDSSGGEGVGQVDGTTTSDPLESHPAFKTIPAKVKTNWLNWKIGRPVDPVSWTPDSETDATFISFYALYSKGTETYLAPRSVARLTNLEDGPPSQNMVGKIDGGWSAITGFSGGPNVDFILSSARGTQEGDKWRNTYEWMGSQVNGEGWNTLLYT
jgi:hypothetical protein